MQNYQNNPDGMASSAQSNATNQMVTKDTLNMPTIKINPNSTLIKNAQTVQDNAQGIASGTYKDCGQHTFNKTTYVNKTCDRPRTFNFTCDKTIVPVFPNDPVVPTKNCEHLVYNTTGTAPANSHLFKYINISRGIFNRYTIYLYLVSGVDKNNQCYLGGSYQQMIGQGKTSQTIELAKKHSFTIHNVNAPTWYSTSITSVSKILSSDSKVNYSLTHTSSSQQSFDEKTLGLNALDKDTSVTQTLSNGDNHFWWGNAAFSYLTFPKVEVPAPTFRTIDQCASSPVAHSPVCTASALPVCKDNKPRTYNGRTYSQCWDDQTTYNCGGSGANTCSPLQGQGCDVLSSSCSQNVGGVCVHDDVTYRCPVSTKQGDGLVCGSHIYCLDGSCQKLPTSSNKDFGEAATQLSAVNSAASDVAQQNPDPSINPNNVKIFSGKTAKCRDMALGVMNCCQDTGWAKGIITNCKDSEKDLGLAKEKGGLVVYVGEYCSYSILGICTEHSKAYCQFPSRMATDVQVGGRKQFGQNFGSADTPNCVGFSPQELQKIDFSKIDFSNVVQQTKDNTNLPNNASEQSAIANEISKKMHGGQS